MLRFGAACCFTADAKRPPSDAEIDAIIDRTRTEVRAAPPREIQTEAERTLA